MFFFRAVIHLLIRSKIYQYISSISHGGRAYLENRPAENAGVFHKGDCPTCAFDDWCHLVFLWLDLIFLILFVNNLIYSFLILGRIFLLIWYLSSFLSFL
ncbi:Uncharacterised protein [Streptococcus suis]|uniref:Uncharacterized protein n=1 Tax=Streptococcus suis TaxID=1307 RepID=A0A822W2R1_STRSU|nr:Uncharacterised protein [Streptococcus suis]CYZ62732.1 Uncharacterised protein [Streptococcus suis]CZA90752.1 Uncharacterised protein [Streptococcus suis]CZB17201.1 Uncharacterised protein [Streptococcus suis]CZB46558.1 Uncharacterised protein [Streptococcus suis]